MSYWDIPVRTLRAFVIILSTTFSAVGGRVDTITKRRAVWVFVAGMTLFITASTPAGQVVKVCVRLVLWLLTCLGMNTAVFAFVTDVTTTFAEAVHVFGVASSSYLSKAFVIRVTEWIASRPIGLLAWTAYASNGPVPLLPTTFDARADRVLLAIPRSWPSALIVRSFLDVTFPAWRPLNILVPTGIGLIVASVPGINLYTLAIICATVATVVLPAPPIAIVTGILSLRRKFPRKWVAIKLACATACESTAKWVVIVLSPKIPAHPTLPAGLGYH